MILMFPGYLFLGSLLGIILSIYTMDLKNTYPCSQAQREQPPFSFTHQFRNCICYHGHKLLQFPIVLYVPLAHHFPHHR